MQIYGIKQHQGTGWSTGALPLFLSQCWNSSWQPFVPLHLLGSQHRGYPSLESNPFGSRERSHAQTDHGRWARPLGTPQQGQQGQQAPCLALHSLGHSPGRLFWSRLFTTARSSVEPAPMHQPSSLSTEEDGWLQAGFPFQGLRHDCQQKLPDGQQALIYLQFIPFKLAVYFIQ